MAQGKKLFSRMLQYAPSCGTLMCVSWSVWHALYTFVAAVALPDQKTRRAATFGNDSELRVARSLGLGLGIEGLKVSRVGVRGEGLRVWNLGLINSEKSILDQ